MVKSESAFAVDREVLRLVDRILKTADSLGAVRCRGLGADLALSTLVKMSVPELRQVQVRLDQARSLGKRAPGDAHDSLSIFIAPDSVGGGFESTALTASAWWTRSDADPFAPLITRLLGAHNAHALADAMRRQGVGGSLNAWLSQASADSASCLIGDLLHGPQYKKAMSEFHQAQVAR